MTSHNFIEIKLTKIERNFNVQLIVLENCKEKWCPIFVLLFLFKNDFNTTIVKIYEK